MTARPYLHSTKQQRPLSAIYIGPSAAASSSSSSLSQSQSQLQSHLEPYIPDLPEPPSPSTSSQGSASGLPSPPATNSTGSGSTGDNNSTTTRGSIRQRPASRLSLSRDNTNMINESYGGSSNGNNNSNKLNDASAAISRPQQMNQNDEREDRYQDQQQQQYQDQYENENENENDNENENENDNDNEEEHTARLFRRQSARTSSENSLALQRVKSLTQRNRMAIDKLTSISRLSTPSPSRGLLRNSRSPLPALIPHAPSSASSSTSASTSLRSTPVSSHSHTHPQDQLPLETRTRYTHSHSQPHQQHQYAHPQSPPDEPPQSGSETERERDGQRDHFSVSPTSSEAEGSISGRSYDPEPSSAGNGNARLVPSTPASASATSTSSVFTPSPAVRYPSSPIRDHTRVRRTSAPASPAKALARNSESLRDREGREGLRTRTAMGVRGRGCDEDGYEDGVGVGVGVRRTPPGSGVGAGAGAGGKKMRGALPREFVDRRGGVSTTGEPGTSPMASRTPSSPQASTSSLAHSSVSGANSHSKSHTHTNSNSNSNSRSNWNSSQPNSNSNSNSNSQPNTSPRARVLRGSATVRDPPRRHQTRWLSEDLSSIASGEYLDPSHPNNPDNPNIGAGGERGQRRRGGSAESPLVVMGGGRSLVGQGLRAAGIATREDVFGGVNGGTGGGGRGGNGGKLRLSDGPRVDWAEVSPEQRSREQERSRMRASAAGEVGGGGYASRAGSSMEYRREEQDEGIRTAPPVMRSFVSAYGLDRERDRDRERERGERDRERERENAGSALSRHTDRAYSSPFGGRRMTPLPSLSGSINAMQSQQHHQGPGQQQSEHTRLMVDSLGMFESHLHRLASTTTNNNASTSASSSSSTIPELLRSAQTIVHASERLNALLRSGTARALEAQIDAEVGDGGDGVELAEVWRRVGGECRESLRVSDELVRSMTGFLLGAGKVLREVGAGGSNGGSEEGGGGWRSVDGEAGAAGSGSGRRSVEVGGAVGSSEGGRRSVDGRRSVSGMRDGRDEVLRRLTGSSGRPPSALARDRDREQDDRDSPAARHMHPTASSAARKLFATREQRSGSVSVSMSGNGAQGLGGMVASDSQETVQAPYGYGYEPSPTPASRHGGAGAGGGTTNTNLTRSRTLPPLSIPPPLPTLPSESLRRNQPTPQPTSHSNHNNAGGAERNGNGTANVNGNGNANVNHRRKPSIISTHSTRPTIAPSLGSPFPVLSTPNPTTALTPHTVSNSPSGSGATAFPLLRTESGRSSLSSSGLSSGVTFSKPGAGAGAGTSLALSGLQEQQSRDNRKRTISTTDGVEDGAAVGSRGGDSAVRAVYGAPVTPLSGSETERDTRRRTIGSRTTRGAGGGMNGTMHADLLRDVHAGAPAMTSSLARKDRRRTVAEIFSG